MDWWSSQHSVAGVDISSTAVKLLQLGRHGGRFVIESYGVVPLPENTVVENTIKDVEAVGEAVHEAMRRSKTTAKRAVVAVPDSAVIRKQLKLDKGLNEYDMEHQVIIQAEKYIPYPLEEVSFDFESYDSDPKSNFLDVMLVACHTENVAQRVEAISLGGFRAQVVDVESFAFQRACQLILDQNHHDGQSHSIAIVDIGAELTKITVLDDNQVIFTREEIFGGAQLTKDIERHYGLSYQEAGAAKKTGNLPDDYEAELLAPFRELAVLQVRRALQFFFSVNEENKIAHIFLVGGTSSIPGLAELIQSQIGIPSTVANPFGDMSVGPNVDIDEISRDSSAMTACCGLALRGFM